MLELDDLPFRDIYLSSDPRRMPRYNPIRTAGLTRRSDQVPAEFLPACKRLFEQAEAVRDRRDFALQLKTIRTRVIRSFDHTGATVYCFRRLPLRIPDIKDGNYQPDFLEEAVHWSKRKGLALTIGETGSGKTTLIMSLLQKWAEEESQVILTIEDPVEFVLPESTEGSTIFQFEVTNKDEWPQHVNNCLRFAPDIILCGEIRTPATAEAVLNLANSGHMVIASLHGSNIITGMQRLMQTAQASDLGDSAPGVFAEAFVGAAHQRIVDGKPVIEFLPTEREAKGPTDPVREYIRKSDFKMIPNLISQRAARRAEARSRHGRPS